MKKLDILALILFPLLATVISLTFKTNLLISSFLFWGLLAIYFGFRTKRAVLRSLTFSLSAGVIFAIVIDLLGSLDNAWYTPTIFNFRILGAPIENFIWNILFTFTILIIYEHFFDKGKHKLFGKRMSYLFLWLLSQLLVVLLLFIAKPEVLTIPYFYLKAGLFFIFFPLIGFLAFFPKFISPFVKIGSYIFIVALINELVALHLSHWRFPGVNFIGWVELLGYKFPFEEFIFFICLSSIALLCYFEFFDDDQLVKK